MFRVLTRAFAVIGFLVVVLIGLAAFAAIKMSNRVPPEPDEIVLNLDFDQPIVEQNDLSPLDLALHNETTPLLSIVRAIDRAKDDPRVKGIVGHFGETQPSLAQAQEIRDALNRFRSSNKFTYAFGPSYGSFGLGNRAYYIASVFENIWLQPVGSVGLSGLAIQSPFAKSALDKAGISADFLQREEYKSFMDMAMRDDWAPPVRANMQDLIDDLSDQEARGIADSRKWDVEHVKDLMVHGPYTDQEALQNGLITKIGYADELDTAVKEKAGKDAEAVDPETYLSFNSPTKISKAETPQTKVALIYGSGMILDKDVGGDGLTGEKILGADTIAGAFDDAAADKDVKAIIFRIDSPGGSPEASETIRRAMVHAQKSGKPVFVSMSDTAASGGYWIAMNADMIVAEPGTLTGSIGVIAGKFVITGLMQKIGVSVGTLKTTDAAAMWSMTDAFTPAQRERLNALMDNSYRAFLQNVSDARKIPMEKMPDIAKGRVWTGAQAAKIGLVDKLGGFDVTLSELRKRLKLGETEKMALEPFPVPETPVEKVKKLLKNIGIESAMVGKVAIEWRNAQASLGPLWRGMAASPPISARMPEDVMQVVR